jgi:hypothetical protein
MPYSTPKFRQIEELAAMRPFQPFTVETNGGSKYVVQSPDHIKLPPFDATLVVIFHDGIVTLLSEDDIKSLA